MFLTKKSENGDLATRSLGPVCDVSIPTMYFVLSLIAVHYRISWRDRITFARINGHGDAMQFAAETGFNVHHSVPWCGVFHQESYMMMEFYENLLIYKLLGSPLLICLTFISEWNYIHKKISEEIT